MSYYSSSDMIEFAKYAKNYSTPKCVEKAFRYYSMGMRLGGVKLVVDPNKIIKSIPRLYP